MPVVLSLVLSTLPARTFHISCLIVVPALGFCQLQHNKTSYQAAFSYAVSSPSSLSLAIMLQINGWKDTDTSPMVILVHLLSKFHARHFLFCNLDLPHTPYHLIITTPCKPLLSSPIKLQPALNHFLSAMILLL